MVEYVTRHRLPPTFNGPLEAGVRAVAILAASHPRSLDLQRLITFDYLLVHTGDVDGPDSLHPPAPLHSAELLVRRKLVEQALLLMITRDLVQREASVDGIRYRAGENAAPFLEALQSRYLNDLKERAKWLVERFGTCSETEFRAVTRQFFDRWIEEFQIAERSLGAEA
jgi:hypothetical protein